MNRVTMNSLAGVNLKNTKIYGSDRRVLYIVSTDVVSDSHTVICKGESTQVVAKVKRHTFVSDTIVFGNKPSMKLSRWLHGAENKWSDLYASCN